MIGISCRNHYSYLTGNLDLENAIKRMDQLYGINGAVVDNGGNYVFNIK